MSYCKLIMFKDGIADSGIEFRNAWGGSARIWDVLFDAHVTKKNEYDSWLTTNNGDDQRLWDLAKNKSISLIERAVLAFTFDNCYVRKEHFAKLACNLRDFVSLHPVAVDGRVDHLTAWAETLDKSDAEAIGLYGTSVGENLWWRSKECPHCGNATDEQEAVPLSEGTEIYDWLASLDKVESATNLTTNAR